MLAICLTADCGVNTYTLPAIPLYCLPAFTRHPRHHGTENDWQPSRHWRVFRLPLPPINHWVGDVSCCYGNILLLLCVDVSCNGHQDVRYRRSTAERVSDDDVMLVVYSSCCHRDRYKVFLDFFNLSTYLLPHNRIPKLTNGMMRRLSTYQAPPLAEDPTEGSPV